MPKLRVHSFAISLDGYGAGPNQDPDNPLGAGGLALHDWILPTRTFQQVTGKDGGESGVDDEFMARGFTNIGAWIIGRNMAWNWDESLKGRLLMRTLKLQVQISVDGFMDGPTSELDQPSTPWSDDVYTYVNTLNESVD